MNITILKTVLLATGLSLMTGCASTYDARKAVAEGGWQKVVTDTRNIDDFPQRDQTLVLNYRAHAKLGLGYYESSRQDYFRAWQIMNQGKGGNVTGALFFSEDQKYWMGDPYERAFNSWYLGWLYYQQGTSKSREDAMASFKNAMFVDTGDLEAGEYAADWIPAFIMRTRCFLARGDEGGAKMVLDELNRLPSEPANFNPDCPWLNLQAQKDANTVIMVELGEGPYFMAGGHHGSQRVTNQSEYEEAYAEILVDGESLGTTYKIGDTFFQAITRGGRVMDEILEGKAIAKTAGIAAGATAMHIGRVLATNSDSKGTKTAGLITLGAGAAVLLASLFMSAEADTRDNDLLPGETHLMMAQLPPGDYDVEVRYFDRNGRELVGMRQRNVPLTVPEKGDGTLLVRSLPRYVVPGSDAAKQADPYANVKQ